MIVEAKQEETVFVDGMPLRVDFSPEAIRQHFDKRRVDQLTDEQLLQVGQAALWSDDLWACFHEILCQAVEEELVVYIVRITNWKAGSPRSSPWASPAVPRTRWWCVTPASLRRC